MPKKYQRFKLLLDESVNDPKYFPLLKQYHDIKHISIDYHLAGISDQEVYNLGIKEQRIIVTHNTKDFMKLAKDSKTGVIALKQTMNNKDKDIRLVALLRKKSSSELCGQITVLTGEGKVK